MGKRTTKRNTRSKATHKTAPRLAATAAEDSMHSAKAGANGTAQNYEEAIGHGQEQLDRASAALFRGYDQIASFNKNNVEALMETSSVLVRGAEDLGKLWISLAQRSLQDGAATAKALAGARSLQDVVDLQNDFARSVVDGLLEDSLQLSEASARFVNEAAAPLQARVNAALEGMVNRPVD